LENQVFRLGSREIWFFFFEEGLLYSSGNQVKE